MRAKDYSEKEMRRILLKRAVSEKEKHRIRKYFQRRSVPEEYLELLSPLEREWFKTRKFKITKRSKIHPIEDILENNAPLEKHLKKNDVRIIRRVWLKDKAYLPALFLYSYHPWIFHPATETVPAKLFNKLIAPYAGFYPEKGDFVEVEYMPLFMNRFINPVYRCKVRFNLLIEKSKEFLLSLEEPFINSLVLIAEKYLRRYKVAIPFKEENCKCVYDTEIINEFQQLIKENRKRKKEKKNQNK